MYQLPSSLSQDIERFKTLADGYRSQSVSPVEFKAFRVPMGVYEQRKNEVYMARIRATGGVIDPQQLLAVIDIALANGSDLLHVTTRAEVQILNLQLERMENVLRALQEAGLATKGGGGNTVRNILVSEWSGIGQEETFDTTPYAMALTDMVVPEGDSYLMPRKMKIAFSSDENYVDYAGINDIGLVAQVRDGKRGFRVYIGGGAGSKPATGWLWREFLPAEDLYTLVKALKTFFCEHGNRKDKYKARIRFIFYKLGQDETFRLIDRYFDEQKAADKHLADRTAEFADEATVRPTVSYSPVTLTADEETAFAQWQRRYVTPQRQSGYASVVIPLVWGNISLADGASLQKLREVIQLAARFGRHTVRFTPKQNIRLRNIPVAALPEVYRLVTAFSGESQRPLVLNNIVSCTGADTCRLGICLSKGLADAIRTALDRSALELDALADARINISGCPNLCGQPLWADLGFVGKVLHSSDHAYPAYQVFTGADYTSRPALAQSVGTVSALKVPQLVVAIARQYVDILNFAVANGVQRPYADFGAYLRSEAGRRAVAALVSELADVPPFAADKNYYFDWGSSEVFNVAQRGKPECSAGLFDMIGVDQEAINAARDKSPYDVIYHASRMLLVTRGLDPATPAEVYDAFIEHFITPGYVSSDFLPLVTRAKSEGAAGDFSGEKALANALADRVIALYQGMDDSLQFHPERIDDGASAAPQQTGEKKVGESAPSANNTTTTGETGLTVARTKDLRGVLCPMNFVRTKLELASLQSGDVLEIWLDDGKPIENVPGSVRLEGHTVISETQTAEGYWQVLIRKK